METPTKSKPWYTSKTLWTMVAALLATIFPVAKEWIETNPVTVIQALAAVAILLRFITHGKISLGWDKDSGNSGRGNSLSLLLLCCVGLAVSGFFLTSCSYLPAGLTGSVYYLDSNTGSKAGLKFEDGKGTGRVFVPVFNEHGEQVGKAELEVPLTVIEATK